jgi:DNA-binding response OmpR family regulator
MDLGRMLALLGCHVAGKAVSLPGGLDGARRLEFDLAIVDLNLGGQNARPIVEEIAHRRIPLIIMSGYDLSQSGERNAHMLLPKPYTLEELRLAISFALDGQASGVRWEQDIRRDVGWGPASL